VVNNYYFEKLVKKLNGLQWQTVDLCQKGALLNKSLFHTDLIQKLLLIDPLICVAVVALSLAILLLCFITFIAFYCPVVFVNF